MWIYFLEKRDREGDEFTPRLASVGKEVRLPEDVRIRARARLMRLISETKQIEKLSAYASTPPRFARFAGVTLAIVFAVMISSAGIAFADDSKPGDALFPVDKFIEEVELFLVRDPNAKLMLSIEIASERLGELEALSASVAEKPSVSVSVDESAKIVGTSTEERNTSLPSEQEDIALEHVLTMAVGEVSLSISAVQVHLSNLSEVEEGGENIHQKDAFALQVRALHIREERALEQFKRKVRVRERDSDEEERTSPRTLDATTSTKQQSERITICHRRGDGSIETIIVSQSALSLHEAHGDTRGACAVPPIAPEKKKNGSTGEISGTSSTTVSLPTQPSTTSERDGGEQKKRKESTLRERRRSEVRQERAEIRGVIERIDESSLTVFGTNVLVDDDTEIMFRAREDDSGELAVGQWLEVEGVISAEGTITAENIKVK